MGERVIRPGIRDSDRTAALVRDAGWMAATFYTWLLTVVDDFGRYDARPTKLRVEVFPLLLEMVREADVQRCLTACEKAGLVRLYTFDGKPFLEVLDFRQRLRAKRGKWPCPNCLRLPRHCICKAASAEEMSGQSHVNVTSMPTETETETETEPPKPPRGGRRERSRSRTPEEEAERLKALVEASYGKR